MSNDGSVRMIPTSTTPGQDHYMFTDVLLGVANQDETAPAADRAIAEAQVHASMAIYKALAGIAAELSIIRRQHEPSANTETQAELCQRCICGPDSTGEAPDERPDCPVHGLDAALGDTGWEGPAPF